MSYIVARDIPKNCIECPCGYETEGEFRDECQVLSKEWEKDADSVRPDWCPLVEVPTPHGRLIDADALMRDIEEYHLSDGKFQHWVEVQQTIIEAEGSEE